jgi:DMSO/TMAO reductase YedYZ heme-binding membrane subunit
MTATLLAASGSKTLWYLTRGSGAVTLALLTVSMCLGIAGTLRWRSGRVPRFTVAVLHRNLTLLAVGFLGIHIVTSVADSFAPIGWKDAVVPFVSAYRPVWLGLGAIAFDLLIALVLTSMLRLRIGLRTWRLVHWAAYACWPLALVHALGSGSDPRATWLQVLAFVSLACVLLALAVRLTRSKQEPALRLGLGAAAFAAALLAGVWYGHGPGARGWAARAGTPASLLRHATSSSAEAGTFALPQSFSTRLSGRIVETAAAGGLVDIHLDTGLEGKLRGRLRVALEGVPLDDGGVSMTASGVAFATGGSDVFQGQIVGLSGNHVSARVVDGSGKTLLLSMVFQLSPGSSAVSGTLQGSSL